MKKNNFIKLNVIISTWFLSMFLITAMAQPTITRVTGSGECIKEWNKKIQIINSVVLCDPLWFSVK